MNARVRTRAAALALAAVLVPIWPVGAQEPNSTARPPAPQSPTPPPTVAPLPTQTTPVPPTATFESLRISGFEDIYSLEYPAALAKFEEMVRLDPSHPAGYFYIATTRWLSILNSMRRLQIAIYNKDEFYGETDDKVDPVLDGQFQAAVQKAIAVAEVRVKANPKDAEALYYLGAAYGVRASYTASAKRSWPRALEDGKRGVGYHRKVLKLDPAYVDANFSIGMQDYILGTIPWPVQGVLRIFGVKGNHKQGLEKLELVAAKGRYARDDAKTMLVAIYEYQRNWTKALAMLDDLSTRYPRNYLFRLERASVLARLGHVAESVKVFEDVLADRRAHSIEDLVRYQYGESLLGTREHVLAGAQFAALATLQAADAGLVTMAHLRRGQTLDAEGRRQEALAEYAIVLHRPNVYGGHAQAKKYSKTPYTPPVVTQKAP